MNMSNSCSQTSISCIKLICCAAYLLVLNTFCVWVFLASSLCTSFTSFFFYSSDLNLIVHCSSLLQYFNHLFRNCNLLWHLGSNITCTFLISATLNLSFSVLFQYQLDFTFLCTFPGVWMSKSLLICKISLIIFYTPLNNGRETLFSCLFFSDDTSSGYV